MKTYPFSPLEIFNLKDIKDVKLTEKKWYMKEELFYF